ncbi:MAG TPA: TolC family protein [Kofleriaceae bacterium]|jgi:outer membrane protein TolC
MVVARRLLASLIVVALASPAIAQPGDEPPYVVPEFMTQLPPLPPNVDAKSVWRLDLAEALQVAIHQNTNVVVERQQVRIQDLGIDVAKGKFEPVVNAFVDHNSIDTPPTTTIVGMAGQVVNTTSQDWNVSASQTLESGAQAQVAFSNNRADTGAADAIDPLLYSSNVTASILQPILRGFSTDLVVPRADVLRAKITSKRERAQLAVTASNIVQLTENAYWDLVNALYTYDLYVHSQQRAQDQLSLTHRQIDAGLLPPSDLITAETTLAQRQLQVVQAELTIEQTSDALRSAMNLPRDQWSRPILPTERPSFATQPGTAEDALAIAIKNRPELAQLDLDVQTAIINLRQAENNKLPQLNLGLSGSLYGVDPTYNGALDGLGRHDATGYSLSLNFSWTPLMRATSAAAEISRSSERIAAANRQQAVQDTWAAVRDAVRNQSSTERQVLAAAKFRELATENLAVEQRKFAASTSSNFLVAQRQEDLATAQLAELQAVLSHKKALVQLLRAEGTLLEARHVLLR